MSVKSKLKTTISALVVGTIIAGGAYAVYGPHLAEAETTEVAAVAAAPQAMPVSVVEVAATPHRLWTDFSGRLAAVDEVNLRPQVSGTIVEVKFEDGQIVQEGDVLFVIDPRTYETAVAEAKADLRAANNNLVLAKKERERAETLVKRGNIAKSVLDERQNAHAVAAATVQGARATLRQTEIALDHAFVKAPITGKVSRVNLTEGNFVSAGAAAPVLTSIVSTDGIYADFEVDEQTYLNKIIGNTGNGKQVPVQLSLANGQVLEGVVDSFDNRIDPRTGTIRTRALFSNEAGTLLPGMFARLSLGTPAFENLITVPAEAVGTDQNRKFVYTVNGDGVVAYREVVLGATIDGVRVVESGLQVGEKVITDNLMKIRPGVPVAPRTTEVASNAS